MTEPNRYVVTANFLGTLTRGDVVTAKQLPADPKDLLANGSIRHATAEEQKSDSTFVMEKHKHFEHRGRHPLQSKSAAPAKKPRKSSKQSATEQAKGEPKAAATKPTTATRGAGGRFMKKATQAAAEDQLATRTLDTTLKSNNISDTNSTVA